MKHFCNTCISFAGRGGQIWPVLPSVENSIAANSLHLLFQILPRFLVIIEQIKMQNTHHNVTCDSSHLTHSRPCHPHPTSSNLLNLSSSSSPQSHGCCKLVSLQSYPLTIPDPQEPPIFQRAEQARPPAPAQGLFSQLDLC